MVQCNFDITPIQILESWRKKVTNYGVVSQCLYISLSHELMGQSLMELREVDGAFSGINKGRFEGP